MMSFLRKTRKKCRCQLVKGCNLIIFIILSIDIYAQQQCNSFEQLTANALTKFIDSLNVYQHKPIYAIDSNHYLFLKDYDECHCMFDYVDSPVYAVLKQEKGYLWLGFYRFNENRNETGWHFTKKVRPKKEHSVNVILKPHYDFASDTLVISFRTASYYRSYLHSSNKRMKTWNMAVSEWGKFKYLYSTEDKKWINVCSEVGGI